MNIKLVALDLDGTALNSTHQLSEATVNVLRKISQNGVVIAIATGRSTSSILKYVDELQLQSQASIPCVGYNGAYGIVLEQILENGNLTRNKKTVIQDHVPIESTRKLLRFAASIDCVVQFYNSELDKVFIVPKNAEHLELTARYAALVGKAQYPLENYDDAIALGAPAKLLIMSKDADRVIAEARRVNLSEEFNIVRGSPDPFFVEFLKPQVSKGAGLKKVCEHLGIAMESVAAFGDGANDKEMLELAGMGIAMKNAQDVAKAAANLIIEWTNDEDGVARQLQRMEDDGCFSGLRTDSCTEDK